MSTARSKTRIPGLVERSILTGIAGRVGLILLLVEAIFLGEKFPDLFNTVVERNGRLWDVFLLMICATPEIFDLALALALLVAVYQVLLRSRENRELQVIAGAGIGTFEFVKFALAVGVVALIGSMLNSGRWSSRLRNTRSASSFSTLNIAHYSVRQGTVNSTPFPATPCMSVRKRIIRTNTASSSRKRAETHIVPSPRKA